MELWEAMEQRHSVRAYQDRPIAGEVKEELEAWIAQCNREGGLHMQPAFPVTLGDPCLQFLLHFPGNGPVLIGPDRMPLLHGFPQFHRGSPPFLQWVMVPLPGLAQRPSPAEWTGRDAAPAESLRPGDLSSNKCKSLPAGPGQCLPP